MKTIMGLYALTCTILLAASMPTRAAPGSARDLATAVTAKPDPVHGKALYAVCVACHGTDGTGQSQGPAPRIAGQGYRVLIRQLAAYRHAERWDDRMEERASSHFLADPQALADVAGYVNAMRRDGARGVGDGMFELRGQQTYVARCQRCHRRDAVGDDDRGVPRIGGQHYRYLLRQIYDVVDGRRPNMPRGHVRLLERLDYEEISGLADYLSRINWTQPEVPLP